MSNPTTVHYTLTELETILTRCRADEFAFSVFFTSDKAHVSLEKGSAYGLMHMKFSAEGATVTEAFEKCIVNFPNNPVGALWDTKRIASSSQPEPPTSPSVVMEGEFTEVVQPPTAANFNDDIPF